MVKNIVFDLGEVIVDFNPQKYMKHIGLNNEQIKILEKKVFYGEEWIKCDAAIYDVKQAFNILMKKYPQYKNEIYLIFDKLDYNYILSEKKDISEYLITLKKQNYNIYILSDINVDSYNFIRNFNFFNYIDGGVYSFEIGTTKPNSNNYITLLNKYNLIPEETIFIDDRPKNIEAATKLGIHGILFTTLEEVKEKIDMLINKKI